MGAGGCGTAASAVCPRAGTADTCPKLWDEGGLALRMRPGLGRQGSLGMTVALRFRLGEGDRATPSPAGGWVGA